MTKHSGSDRKTMLARSPRAGPTHLVYYSYLLSASRAVVAAASTARPDPAGELDRTLHELRIILDELAEHCDLDELPEQITAFLTSDRSQDE